MSCGRRRERQIVIGIEPGERVGRALVVRGAEIAAHQPVAVERVQRELVQVDPSRDPVGEQAGQREHAEEPAFVERRGPRFRRHRGSARIVPG